MSRSRRVSATTSLPKPATLPPGVLGRSIAPVSELAFEWRPAAEAATSRLDWVMWSTFHVGELIRPDPTRCPHAIGQASCPRPARSPRRQPSSNALAAALAIVVLPAWFLVAGTATCLAAV